MDIEKIVIEYMTKVTDEQLWDFYVRNDICEVGHGKEVFIKDERPYV